MARDRARRVIDVDRRTLDAERAASALLLTTAMEALFFNVRAGIYA